MFFLGALTVWSAFRAPEKTFCSGCISSTFFPGLLLTPQRVAEQTLGVPREGLSSICSLAFSATFSLLH